MHDWWVTLHNGRFCQLQSHVTQKLGKISKIRPDKIYISCSSLRISGQLPAPIVNGRERAFKNGRISNLQGLMTLILDWVIHRASLIDLYLHAKFHWNQRNFLWTDGQTLETGFIRSTQKIQPKNRHAIYQTVMSHVTNNQNLRLICTV